MVRRRTQLQIGIIPNAGRDIASEPGHAGSEIDETPTNDVGGPNAVSSAAIATVGGVDCYSSYDWVNYGFYSVVSAATVG